MSATSGVTPALQHELPRESRPVERMVVRHTTQSVVTAAVMMATDIAAVWLALLLAFEFDIGLTRRNWESVQQPLAGSQLLISLGYLAFFTISLLLVSRQYGLYGQLQTQSILHEQRRTVQACFTAGLLLCGSMYLTHNVLIPRGVVIALVCISTVLLSILRGLWRYMAHRDYERGIGTRNVLIVGDSQLGDSLRQQMERHRRLGRVFKGFISLSGDISQPAAGTRILGNLFQLRHLIRQHFIDEIVLTERCGTEQLIELVGLARDLDVEIVAVPGVYEEASTDSPIFFMGDFPVVAIHRRNDKALSFLVKRIVDTVLSVLLLTVLAPLFVAVALAVKLSSPGPVFYVSERVGRKGRIFRLWKFRTMVPNAEKLKASLMAAHASNDILFKMKNDPRITPIGRILRKFSLDELPQIFNVLLGDMSLVGPRPPLATEVARYELKHYRRLEVLPGLTGLWQVRARHEPSFDQYIALDIAYVENWNFWMDLKILIRTAEVVVRGTGS
ncbi:sugar transferase [Silvibacterium acidisoli]|uniref:sugar transferase n=1 Tax=Acidobacteriaceae bacterium ZG23-2 TaxID=2883246 RepID=UPI00406C065D